MAEEKGLEEVIFVNETEEKAPEEGGEEESESINMTITVTMQSLHNSLSQEFAKGLSSLRSWSRSGMEQLTVLGVTLKNQIKHFREDFEVQDWLSVEGLIYLTLLIMILVSFLIISVNIYRKIRYAIPSTVNCWFCNCNSKVLYSLRDTWTCPKCHQYNGFTKDGNYNKRIPAQYIEALNRPIRGCPPRDYQPKKGSNTDGLCSQCSLNQVLKVFQLSSFQPVNERNFDAEIDAEQKRLEQLYDICPQCKVLVEEILQRPAEKQQLPTRRKSNVNKVIPHHPQSTEFMKDTTRNSTGSFGRLEPSGLHSDLFKDVSNSSFDSGSGESFLSLDNLKIGSKDRARTGNFQSSNSPPQHYYSPSPPASVFSMPVYSHPNGNSPSLYGTNVHQRFQKEPAPLWKDYPLVQGGMSPTYSVIDSTMNCSMGRQTYITYNQMPSAQTSQFNYQSSTAGSVFGGSKPLISPPKFSNGNSARSFTPYNRYGSYYEIPSNQPRMSGRNGMSIGSPVMINQQHYFPLNPISRTSSQSSGFVSQQGGLGGTPPPPGTPPTQTPPTSVSFYPS